MELERPLDALNHSRGKNILVELKNGKQFAGKLKSFDIYYELGVGIDFYSTYFKFSTEIKYSVGLLNVVSSDASEN